MNTKGKIILWTSFLQQLVALSWFTILQNDPSAIKQHTWDEWLVILATSSVVLSLGVLLTWRGLLSNPSSPDGMAPTNPQNPPSPTQST